MSRFSAWRPRRRPCAARTRPSDRSRCNAALAIPAIFPAATVGTSACAPRRNEASTVHHRKSKKTKATPHNAIKEINGEQPTRKQLEALLNLFARQQQIKPSDRVCQRGSDLPMRAGYSLLQFAFASLGIVSFGIEAGVSKPQRHVRLWHEPKISHARAA